VRHCPDEAHRIASGLAEKLLTRLQAGSPLKIFPEVAGLLLAYPDVRRPSPVVHQALHAAALHTASPRQTPDGQSLALLHLMHQRGLLQADDPDTIAAATERWSNSVHPGQEPFSDIALTFAMNGDIAKLMQHAEVALTSNLAAQALCIGATYLAGLDTAPALDNRLTDRALRTCLALALATRETSRADEVTAIQFCNRLLAIGNWTFMIPLLPLLPPAATNYLGRTLICVTPAA
jgi:hypothetical protein